MSPNIISRPPVPILSTTENATVLSVKQAYYGVLQAKRNRDVAADVIRQFQLHLDQARGFYEVGTKAKIDVIKAEVDLSNAKLSLINAENSLKIAWVNLNNAMGVPDAPEYTIEDNLSFQPYRDHAGRSDGKGLREQARPQIDRCQKAGRGIGHQRRPVRILSGPVGKCKLHQGGRRTVIRVTLKTAGRPACSLTVPLFSGFLTSHQVAEAKSNLYVLKANEEAFRQQVLLDVRQAYPQSAGRRSEHFDGRTCRAAGQGEPGPCQRQICSRRGKPGRGFRCVCHVCDAPRQTIRARFPTTRLPRPLSNMPWAADRRMIRIEGERTNDEKNV